MRKSSSFSPNDRRPGANGNFKKGGGKPHEGPGPYKKKNYDGRSASGSPARSARPYSGRTTDSDQPARFSDKPAFGKDRKGAQDDRKPRKEFKPFKGDDDRKPRKEFKPFKGDDDRKPRKEFKPFNKDDDRKPYDRPKRSFDKPPFDKEHRNKEHGESSYGKPTRSSKPYSGRTTDSDRPARSFDKPAFGTERQSGRDDRKPRKEFKPFKRGDDRKPTDRPKRSFDKPPFDKDHRNKEHGEKEQRNDSRKPGRPADSRPFRHREQPAGKHGFEKKGGEKENKDDKPVVRTFSDVVKNVFNAPPKNKDANADHPGKREQFEDKVYGELQEPTGEDHPIKPYARIENKATGKKKHQHDHPKERKKKYKDEEDDMDEEDTEINQKSGPRLEMPLNKYIAHSGECSRRDAAELVRQGKVKVNGELVLEPGYKVKHDDKVTLSGKKMTPQKGNVYILLNKPKGYITTNEDPQGRKTVMDLVTNTGADRLFPVGRLDRDTSGLLLITNDGELTQKLCHPSYNIKKVYHVTLDKPLTKADFEKIVAGVELEDGKAIVDEIAYLETKNELGLEIHSGKNRIVRRIFESLGYVVEKLDRMMYAGLTKKNLPRGKWRKLDEREVVLLKHFKS